MTLDQSLTYEQALGQLDATLRSLAEGKLSLEDSITAEARGLLQRPPQHLRGGLVGRRQLLEVVGAERHHRRVEVLALLLEVRHVAGEQGSLAFRQSLELVEVDRELRRKGRLAHALELFG